MKRISRSVVLCVVVGLAVLGGLGGSASAASTPLVRFEAPAPWPAVSSAQEPARLITPEERAAQVRALARGDGFRIQAGRVPDGWLEARAAARTVSAEEIVLGLTLGLLFVVTVGALGGSLVLFLRPRALSWTGLLRGRSRAMLGRL